MKKLMLMAVMMLMSIGAFAQAGKMAVGTQLGYAGYGDGYSPLGIGAKFQYGFTDAIRGELSYDYWFPKDKVGCWDANLNFHYLVDMAENMKVYPLAGVTLVGLHGDDTPSDKAFGFNIGAGFQYLVSEDINLFAEAKYQSAKKEEHGINIVKAQGPIINIGFTVAF